MAFKAVGPALRFIWNGPPVAWLFTKFTTVAVGGGCVDRPRFEQACDSASASACARMAGLMTGFVFVSGETRLADW